MNNHSVKNRFRRDYPERRRLPHIGQRITKTTVAVFICLVIYWLRGYQGQDMPTEAAITAIVCMQPYVRDARDYALNRLAGSLIGAVWGLLLLVVLYALPALSGYPVVLYGMMAGGVLLSLYTAVALRVPDASSLAAIVFLCVVITFPDIEEPLRQAGVRILDIFIGTAVAVVVNVVRLPRRKNHRLVFFIRTQDLAPDRFSRIPSAVLFRLNHLYNDGARICLMSEHAPAFFALQMSAAMVNTPLIVMDGAAIYDPNENVYLSFETIPPAVSELVRARLDALGVSYFVYTIHHNKTCIFHHGSVRPEEQVIYDRMHGSPYRSYLEGEIYEPSEIVYFKIITKDAELPLVEERLRHMCPKGQLRLVIRPQAGAPGISAMYFYSRTAEMVQAQKRLMKMLGTANPDLEPLTLTLREGFSTEHDAVHLLHQIEKHYEPVRLPWNKAE